MKISNKLSTKDFVDLQKILFNEHNISPALKFILKWVTSALYALAAFTVFYLILNYLDINNIYLLGILDFIIFILLVATYPQRTRSKMNKIIGRYYGKENLDVVRDTYVFEDELYFDDKGKKKTYNLKELKYSKLVDNKLFLIFPEENGTILNLEGLNEEEKSKIISWTKVNE